MAKATQNAQAASAPVSRESLVEMGVDLFRTSVKPQSDAVETIRMGSKYVVERGKSKGEIGVHKRDVIRLQTAKAIQEANPKLSKAQVQAKQAAAGKDLLKQAAHYITEAQADKAVICNRITHSLTDLNVNLHKVSVQDEAMKLHVSTGRPLDECRAFIAGKAVKAVE